MTIPSHRCDSAPILQTVSAYGSETFVPKNDICRLSYYLKCYVVGCGSLLCADPSLWDYMNAHTLSVERQEELLRYVLLDFNVLNLLARGVFVMDEKHELLPAGTLNTFLEVKTIRRSMSAPFLHVPQSGKKQVSVSKVMFCDSKWIQEYFVGPFLRYQSGTPILEVEASPVENNEEVSYSFFVEDEVTRNGQGESDEIGTIIDYRCSRSRCDQEEEHLHPCHQCDPGIVVTPIHNIGSESSQEERPLNYCSICNLEIHTSQTPMYVCTDCPARKSKLCHDCYNAGFHDHTHAFERICDTSIETLPARAKTITYSSDLAPDVPMALSVPLQRKAQKPDLPTVSEAKRRRISSSRLIHV